MPRVTYLLGSIETSGIPLRFSGNRKPETGNRKPETGNRKPETEGLPLRPEEYPEQKADDREHDQHDDPDEADEHADAGLGGLDDGPDEYDQPDQAEQADFGTHGVLLQLDSTSDYSRSAPPGCGWRCPRSVGHAAADFAVYLENFDHPQRRALARAGNTTAV